MTTTTKPHGIADCLPEVGVYIACLAAYNSGTLHGACVDLELTTDADDIQACIDWVISTSPEPGAEEWAMHDSAGLPSCLSRTEWPSLEDLATYAEALGELTDEDEREAFRLWCDNCGQLVSVDEFREAYRGCHPDPEAYCQDLAEELGVLPDKDTPWPCTCIDWAAAWRELTFDGHSSEPASSGGVHIFWSC